MAQWGYEKGFVVEHDPTVKKRISCRDCIYYDASDRSCLKRPLYLPEDGYDSWRRCSYFDLSNKTHNYEIKYEKLSRRKRGITGAADTDDGKRKAKPSMVGKYVFMLPLSYVFITKKQKVDSYKKQEIRDYYYKNGIFDKPILVRASGNQYQVVDGFARYAVAQELALKEVPLMLDTSAGKKRYNLCKKGLRITHNSFGAGVVERYDLLYIVVKFHRDQHVAKFSLDMCADKQVVRKP